MIVGVIDSIDRAGYAGSHQLSAFSLQLSAFGFPRFRLTAKSGHVPAMGF